MHQYKGRWSAVETENFTEARAHVVSAPWRGDDTQTWVSGLCENGWIDQVMKADASKPLLAPVSLLSDSIPSKQASVEKHTEFSFREKNKLAKGCKYWIPMREYYF